MDIFSIAFGIGKSSNSSKKVFTIRISKFHTEKALRFEPVNLNFFKAPFFKGMAMVLRLGSSAPLKKITVKRDYEIIEASSIEEMCDSLYEFIESIPFGTSFFFEDCIKNIGTSASERKNLWPLYFPDIIFSGALVQEKANLFRKIDLPKDLNPKVVIERLSYNGRHFMVARDDLLLGGTKQRVVEELFKLHPKGIIYPGPPTGYAQIALALGALKYGSEALILLPKVRPMTPQTRLALQLGASIFEYEGESGSLKNLKKEAEAFARGNDLYLPELGFSGSEFRDLMKVKLKEALEGFDANSITDVWVAGGSGALAFTLHDFFPKAMLHVVQVGKQLDWYFGPTSGNGQWSTIHIAKEKFSQKTMDPPPYPSLEEYDAKVWSFAKHHLSPTTLIWNVAGPPKNF